MKRKRKKFKVTKAVTATAGAAYAAWDLIRAERGASQSGGFIGSIEESAREITKSGAASLAARDESLITNLGLRDSFDIGNIHERGLGGIR